MQKFETTKLFWGQYLYRLSIKNSLATIFREKNLSFARQVLDQLQYEYEQGNKLELHIGIRERPIPEDNFLDAKKLYKFFSRYDEYKLRVESISMSIYSNDIDWLKSIIETLTPSSLISLHEPDPKFKDKLQINTILIPEDIGYQYRVTFGQRKGSPEFARWSEVNPKLVKIGDIAKKELLNEGYVNGMYFYARDERIIELCNLMLSNIRRIDKLVVKQDIDK